MGDGDDAPSGAMLRRSLMLLAGCSAAALGVPSLFGNLNVGSGDAAVPAPPPRPRAAKIPVAEPPATQSYRAERGNQFFLPGSVNGTPVRFLLDTGATFVALTAGDATRLGYDLSKLSWNKAMQTANGISHDAEVTLADIRLNRIIEYNVPAIVMRQGNISLLGMSFLSRLRTWQISDGVLTIAS
jgi:aspartyl protease family protein